MYNHVAINSDALTYFMYPYFQLIPGIHDKGQLVMGIEGSLSHTCFIWVCKHIGLSLKLYSILHNPVPDRSNP
jgi:hypothetical protein